MQKKYFFWTLSLSVIGCIAFSLFTEISLVGFDETNLSKIDSGTKIPIHPLNRPLDFNYVRKERTSWSPSSRSIDEITAVNDFKAMATSRVFSTLDQDKNITEEAIKNANLSKVDVKLLNRIFADYHSDMLELIRNNLREAGITEEDNNLYYNYEILPYLSHSVERLTKLVSSIESGVGKDRAAVVLSGYPLAMNYLGSGQYQVKFSLYVSDSDVNGWRCRHQFIDPTKGRLVSEGMYNFDATDNNEIAEIFDIK